MLAAPFLTGSSCRIKPSKSPTPPTTFKGFICSEKPVGA